MEKDRVPVRQEHSLMEPENAQALEKMYDMLFCAWPLMRRKLLPTTALQNCVGMPFSHIQVLALVDHYGSLSITQISNLFGMAKSNITPLIDRMIEHGLVRRERMMSDKRIVSVVICEEGKKRLEEVNRLLYDHLFAVVRDLGKEDLHKFTRALEDIVSILTKED
ncbi:MAG TPA: MarR family transcriptional regulator [Candidatus Pullichristensenella excrementigallinarum]|uniref:MarR family transcriptional regulator n=1 Tax=Candidatus Pullichristensenella excrementigallinarum TaxID=2840907 RepID=A0A9D1IE86_9FIRM|nr:MarR family transcriptional regulator [Candidatus Pullichristensenella excrementigallinarum]